MTMNLLTISICAFFLASALAISDNTLEHKEENHQKIVPSQKLQNVTIEDVDETDKGVIEWFNSIFGLKPTTTTTTTTPQPSPVSEQPEKCPSCKCGLTNKQKRIVGGVETLVNEYPWMVLLLYRGRFYCGGSVINSKYVLTAAHCIDRFQPELMSIRLLEHDRDSANETTTIDFKVEKVVKHGRYSTLNYNNDIGLIKIAGEFQLEGLMRPVCLPEKGKTFSGHTGVVTGWGAIESSGPLSPTLQEVSVPIMSNSECRATKYPARRITDNMLCAGYKEGSKDSCQGDSGGPLHVKNEDLHQVVGVVSWGEGCAVPNYPGVYTRVNRFVTWIERNTEDACYC